MKLIVKDDTTESPVKLTLEKYGTQVHLVASQMDKSDQVLLRFYEDGRVEKDNFYEDFGFKRDAHNMLVIG